MSISAMLNTTLTGLFASQEALRITSNNIANVNTEGYARQIARQENITVAGNSLGVKIVNVERIIDKFLQAAGLTAVSDAKSGTVARAFHDRFQSLLGRPDSSSTLTARIDALFTSLTELSLSPADGIVRQGALASVEELTAEISNLARAVQDLRTDASNQIADKMGRLNASLKRIDDLNRQIVRQSALGGETAGLESQRDQALQNVAELVDIRISYNSNGSVFVGTTSGVQLLDNALREFNYKAPGTVTAETVFPSITIRRIDRQTGQSLGTASRLDDNIISGELRGLLDMRDKDFRNLSLGLGEMASGLADQLNAVHNQHSAVPAPNKLVGGQTFLTGSDATGFTGKVTFAVLNASSQLVRKVQVDFDGAPPADMNALISSVNTGLSGDATLSLNNGVLSLTASNAVNGVLMTDDATTPSSRGGRGFSHFFGMNDLVTSSVPGIYETGLKGTEKHNLVAGGTTIFELHDQKGNLLKQYSLGVAGTSYDNILADLNGTGALGGFVTFSLDSKGALQTTKKTGFEGVRLSVTSDSSNIGGTGVTLSALFGIGDKFTANAARNIKVVDVVKLDPARMALSKFGDTVAVGVAALSSGDQSGALTFAALENKLVKFKASGAMSAMTVSMSRYAATFLSQGGLLGSRARAQEADSIALLTEIKAKQSDVSGVNLDEELANMVMLQNSYNAAARLISTAQEMMRVLLEVV